MQASTDASPSRLSTRPLCGSHVQQKRIVLSRARQMLQTRGFGAIPKPPAGLNLQNAKLANMSERSDIFA